MKILAVAIVSSLLGLAAAGGVAFWSYADPGPDFLWIEKDIPSYELYEDPRPEERPQQKIEVIGGEEFDFGVMDRGETRRHAFVVQNNTHQPIEFSEGPSTCKCTVQILEQNRLMPGERCDIILEWVAKSLETEFRQSATINTSSPVRPKILLSIFGRVLQIVQPVPGDIAFSDVTVRDEREAEFTLFCYKDSDLEILEYRWADPETAAFFELEYEPASSERLAEEEGAQSAIDCTVRMKSGLPLGPVRQLLEIVTSAARSGSIDIPIQARIVGDVSLTGSGYSDQSNQLRLPPVRRDKGQKHKLFIIVKGPFAKDFEVTAVRTDPADVLHVQVLEPRELRDGAVRIFPVEIEIPAGAKPVNFSGGEEHPLARITFETTHPEIPEVGLDVRFAIVE